MPLPTSIADLSQTPSSNSPAGSESPTLIDDYLQTYAAYIAQLRDGNGFLTAVRSNNSGTASVPAFSFVGDTNTGFYRPAADTIAVSVNGAEAARVDASGNVGVGTDVARKLSHEGLAKAHDLVVGLALGVKV